MLLSMTGHGEARCHGEHAIVGVEVRAVNNRFLKVSTRISEGFSALEPLIEAAVKQKVRRGTIQVYIRIDREPDPDDFRLNEGVLTAYRQQLDRVNQTLSGAEPIRLELLLGLPGVVSERQGAEQSVTDLWPLIENALLEALDNLSRMRVDEGAAMAADLHANCQAIVREMDRIAQRAPLVVDSYQRRLTERVNKLLAEFGIELQPADVVREVGVFADRSDISEEVVRLRSHLEQFESIARAEEGSGRKLEFVIQEMLRETNTIGSKANDAEISRHVVEIKTAIERMREMIQNVE